MRLFRSTNIEVKIHILRLKQETPKRRGDLHIVIMHDQFNLIIYISRNLLQGIEGFVYRNSIKIKVQQLYKFKMRKYTHMEKRHYLAAVNGNRLTILEAKMQGEKLDLIALNSISSCSINACPRR